MNRRGHISLSAKLYARLKQYSKETGESMASIVERVIKAQLDGMSGKA